MFRSIERSFLSTLSVLTLLALWGCGGGSSGTSSSTGGSGSPGGLGGGASDKSSTPAASATGGIAKKPGVKVIAVIPKSTTHEFWHNVHEGALAAAKDHNVEIVFKAGEPGDQAQPQLTLVDQMIASQVDAIVLAPVHAKFLVQAADKCAEAKIPLVIIDSGLDPECKNYVSYIATDNTEGGAQCARALAKAVGEKGDVLLLRYQPGSLSTMEREHGFTDTLAKEFPNVKIINQDKYAGATREDAIKSSNELLGAYPTFQGVFASNESSAIGMLTALREKGLAGKVKFVAFDTAKVLLDAVESGDIVALAAQNPRLIGSEGITQALNALEKQKIDAFVQIPAVMKDKAAIALEYEIKKQEEADKLREEKIKAMLKENDERNAAIMKEFEEKKKQSDVIMQKQKEEEDRREAEVKRLKALNDKENDEKIKELEAAQLKYKEHVATKAADDAKHDADLKAMKEKFDKEAEEQKKKLEAEEAAKKK